MCAVRRFVAVVVVLAALWAIMPGPADAQSFTAVRPGGRAGTWEFTLPLIYADSARIEGQNGTSVDINSGYGFGFGFGYNFTGHLAMHLNTTWATMNYKAEIATVNRATGAPGTATTSGTLDTGTVAVDMTYYLLQGPVTPFLMGGVGWTLVDSNISSGPPQDYCWYDPWYGYVCDSYQSTYYKDMFSYNVGVGARWDVVPGFFLRGLVGMQWLNTDSETIDTTGGRVDIGFMF